MAMIDPDSLHMRREAHLNGGSAWFGFIHRCVEHPRLTRKDVYSRLDKSVTSTFRVDGADCPDLQAALIRLEEPPVLTVVEAEILRTVSDDPTDRRMDIGNHRDTWHWLREKGLVEWQSGCVRRTQAGRDALASLRQVEQ